MNIAQLLQSVLGRIPPEATYFQQKRRITTPIDEVINASFPGRLRSTKDFEAGAELTRQAFNEIAQTVRENPALIDGAVNAMNAEIAGLKATIGRLEHLKTVGLDDESARTLLTILGATIPRRQFVDLLEKTHSRLVQNASAEKTTSVESVK